MRQAPAAALAIAAAALFATPAALAAAPTNAQLQAEITALQTKLAKDEKTLVKQTKTIKELTNGVNLALGGVGAALAFSGCGLAVTADAFQGVFQVIDQIAPNTPNIAHTYFGVQTPVSDQTACTLLKVVRTQVVPPTTAPFTAVLSLLRPTSAATAFDQMPGVILRR